MKEKKWSFVSKKGVADAVGSVFMCMEVSYFMLISNVFIKIKGLTFCGNVINNFRNFWNIFFKFLYTPKYSNKVMQPLSLHVLNVDTIQKYCIARITILALALMIKKCTHCIMNAMMQILILLIEFHACHLLPIHPIPTILTSFILFWYCFRCNWWLIFRRLQNKYCLQLLIDVWCCNCNRHSTSHDDCLILFRINVTPYIRCYIVAPTSYAVARC